MNKQQYMHIRQMAKLLSCLTLTVFLVLSIPMTVSAKKLNRRDGVNYFGIQKETYYNLDMSRIYERADGDFGSHHKRWIRADGCKMYGDYIIVAAHQGVHPYGSIVETSLGQGIVLDTGRFALTNQNQIDIATTW